MELLIFSDSHGRAENIQVALERQVKAPDAVLFLGDGARDLDRIFLCDVPLWAVRGNCDAEVDQMVLDFPCMADYAWIIDSGHQLYCTHGHLWDPEKLPPLAKGTAFLYGHFHVKRNEMGERIRLFNPGSVGLPKDGTN